MFGGMKHVARLSLSALALIFGLQAAQAACYADYQAKRDNPLRLHYGVIELPDAACGTAASVRKTISERIARDGWKLLKVKSVFEADGLEKRRKDAGSNFLRY